MTFRDARARRKEGLKKSRKIDSQREKIAVEKARIKKKICGKIYCDDCIYEMTDKCVEFVKDGDFSALLNWAKGKCADTEAEEKEI